MGEQQVEWRDGFCADCGAATALGTNVCRSCAMAAATARLPHLVREELEAIADSLEPAHDYCKEAHARLRKLLDQTPMTDDTALREAAYEAFAETTGYRKPTDRELIRHGVNAAINVYLAALREPLQEGRDHLTVAGTFQSDKYPTVPAGLVPLKVTDRLAQDLLWEYARRHREAAKHGDSEFPRDLESALRNAGFEPPFRGDARLAERERDTLLVLLTEIVRAYDAYRARGALPAPELYEALISAIGRARTAIRSGEEP